MLEHLKDNKGFTFIELLMVFVVLGILAQMTGLFVMDLRSRSYDVTAIADGRNLVTVIRDNFVSLEDVDYTHNPGDGPDIGEVDTGGAPRTPVFTLSDGVEVTINGQTDPTGQGAGLVVATFYHREGTEESTPSGRREYFYIIDELGTDVLATFD